MDIDLLSKMVKELVLDNDKVVLPGLGAFVTEVMPSTFSDRGYTINPPYRKLYFRATPDEGDDLARFYASSNNVELDFADKIIRDFVSELKNVLFAKKTVIFPGLGRLRATKENSVFFIADPELDIYPEGFALEPVSLKTHDGERFVASSVETGQKPAIDMTLDVDALVSELTDDMPLVHPVQRMESDDVQITEAPEISVDDDREQPETVGIEPETVETEPEVVALPEAEPEAEPEVALVPETVPDKKVQEMLKGPTLHDILEEEKRRRRRVAKFFKTVVLSLLIIAVTFFVLYISIARFFPTSFDHLLYTEEELEIINSK